MKTELQTDLPALQDLEARLAGPVRGVPDRVSVLAMEPVITRAGMLLAERPAAQKHLLRQ